MQEWYINLEKYLPVCDPAQRRFCHAELMYVTSAELKHSEAHIQACAEHAHIDITVSYASFLAAPTSLAQDTIMLMQMGHHLIAWSSPLPPPLRRVIQT